MIIICFLCLQLCPYLVMFLILCHIWTSQLSGELFSPNEKGKNCLNIFFISHTKQKIKGAFRCLNNYLFSKGRVPPLKLILIFFIKKGWLAKKWNFFSSGESQMINENCNKICWDSFFYCSLGLNINTGRS